MTGIILTAEAKATMIANLELELNARKEKLRAMCEAQCASLRSRLERRVNRIPAAKRQMPLVEFLAPPAPAPVKAASTKTAPSKATATKKAIAAAPTTQPAAATATRKGRAAPTTSKTTALATKPAPATKAAPKPAATKSAPKPTTTRGKKRGSDEMSSEDKENTAELDVPKKRARAPVSKAPAATTKTAPATRATRATSRQKTNPAQVLSPKNSNPRQKPAKPATRPR